MPTRAWLSRMALMGFGTVWALLERLRDRLIEADRQRRVLVSERGQEGGHEAVPRDLAHRGQHAFVALAQI